jgi:hypothetical protein
MTTFGSVAAEQLATRGAHTRLAGDAAYRLQLLLSGRIHEAVAAARAVQLEIGVSDRGHAAQSAAPWLRKRYEPGSGALKPRR